MDSAKPARHRILIADDSEVCCVLLAMILKKTDHEVRCVFDGAQAVAAVREEPFDLVLLDQEMPKLDGLGALAMIRVLKPRLPVVICSGTISPEHAARFERLGVSQLVKKPVDPLRLRKIVDDVVTAHRRKTETVGSTLGEGATGVASPGRDVAAVQRAMETPLLLGVSPAARRLTEDFGRIRRFKSAAAIEGPAGSGKLDIAVALADTREGVVSLCRSDEVDETLLGRVLTSGKGAEDMVTLIVTTADRLAPAQQTLLANLLGTGAGGGSRPPLKALRLILCAESSLSDRPASGSFDDRLLLRIGATTMRVPSLAARQGDLGFIAQGVLRRIGLGRIELTPEAQTWLEAQNWGENYRQFHRTIEIACPLIEKDRRMDAAHLRMAREVEPKERGPLFHDLIVKSLCEPDATNKG